MAKQTERQRLEEAHDRCVAANDAAYRALALAKDAGGNIKGCPERYAWDGTRAALRAAGEALQAWTDVNVSSPGPYSRRAR